MSSHAPQAEFQRWCDVAVIGGSATGLAGALMLARSRRSVIVLDGGEPRNAPAAHMHGYLGYEGRPPADLIAAGRAEVRSYGVEILEANVEAVAGKVDDGFRVAIVGGGTVVARRVLVATGAVDRLPELDGLAEHWGSQVIHCPYCHGWEVRGQRIVVLATNRWAPHQTALFGQLSDRVTVVVHDRDGVGAGVRAELDELAVEVIDGPARRVVSGGDGRLTGIEVHDGRVVGADAVVVSTRVEARGEILRSLGIEATEHASGIGTVIDVDELGQTASAGVYAAGNATDPSLQVLPSAAAGSRVGAIINAHLVDDDRLSGDGGRPTEWDRRYGGRDQVWSGNPNGTLVAEVSDLTPGSVLDVGCGEGGDAVWLAGLGWAVTALDVATVAVERTLAAAAQRGVTVHGVCNDLPGAAFAPGTFDLVSAQYPAIPRTPEGEALTAMLAAVAPGGTLLAVFHDLDEHDSGHRHVRPFDMHAYVSAADIVGALDPTQWVIEVHETRDRPGGHAEASHHHRDVVIRAVRRSSCV